MQQNFLIIGCLMYAQLIPDTCSQLNNQQLVMDNDVSY